MKQGINMQKKTPWGAPLNMGLLALAGLVLTGCGKQAPDCASKEIGAVIKNIATEQVVSSGASWPADKAIRDKYLDGIKLSFGTTVEVGNNKETKLRTCQGQYSLSSATGEKLEISDTEWSAQVTSDGKDFVVKIPQSLARGLGFRLDADFQGYLIAEKLSGLWVGTVSCPRPEGEDSTAPAQKDFPMSLNVDAEAKLSGKMSLQTGGYTDISGTVNPFTNEVQLSLVVVTPEGVQKSRHGPYTGKLNGNALQMKFDACSVDLKRQ